MTVSYVESDSIAHISIDDGKRNALTPGILAELQAALDRALERQATVVLGGREGVLSAGFDLKVLAGPDALSLVRAGFELASRLYAFPRPVIAACPGHAIAMGSFLLLASDYRIGVQGEYKLGANEVAVGMTLPKFAVELCRLRLLPTHFHRAVELAEMFAPEAAVTAGFLDRVVPAADLDRAVRAEAERVKAFDRSVHAETKRRARAHGVEALAKALAADFGG